MLTFHTLATSTNLHSKQVLNQYIFTKLAWHDDKATLEGVLTDQDKVTSIIKQGSNRVPRNSDGTHLLPKPLNTTIQVSYHLEAPLPIYTLCCSSGCIRNRCGGCVVTKVW